MAIAEIDRIAEASPVWVRELEAWSSMPAESPAWDDLERFIDALRGVAAQKQEEREAGRRELRTALEELRRDFSGDLDYFEAAAGAWSAEAVAREEAGDVAARIRDLHSELGARRSLQSKPAEHYAEARRLREEINGIEDVICAHIEALAGTFGGSEAAAPREKPMAAAKPAAEPISLAKTAVVREEAAPVSASATQPLSAAGLPPTDTAKPGADTGGELHRPTDVANGRYSPLTRDQERSALGEGSGVSILLASGALGFEHLPDAVSTLVSAEYGGQAAYGALAPSVTDSEALYKWLSDFSGAHPGAERLVVCQPVAMASAEFAGRIAAAHRFCADNPTTIVRVLFFLAPGAIGAWLALPDDQRNGGSDRPDAAFALKPWTAAAVQDRLERQGKLYDADTRDSAMGATGGWSWCVDKLFEFSGGASDPRPAIEKMSQGLFRGGELHDELLMRVGVRPDTVAAAVLDLVLADGEVEASLITPDLLGGQTTAEECRVAVQLLQALSCAKMEGQVLRANPFLANVIGRNR